MKVHELIKQLQGVPGDMDVMVYDWKRNAFHADADGVSDGVHPDIELHVQTMTNTEGEEEKEVDVLTIQFESDYGEEGSYWVEEVADLKDKLGNN